MILVNGKKELIFEPDTAPFPSCHASNMVCLADGSILVVWFGGEKEGNDDVAIWGAKRIDGKWTAPFLIAKDCDEPHWNPVLYSRPDGEIVLFYKVGKPISHWHTNVRISRDNGETWSEPRELVPGDRGGRGPVRCKTITLSNGTLLAGASTEDGPWIAYADRSHNHGETWHLSHAIAIQETVVDEKSDDARGVIQPTLWESAPGMVHMLLRSTEGKIYRADSADFGENWTEPYPTALPNNNSGIDVVKCEDGALILCSNPVGINGGPRTPLTLQLSRDNGETWAEIEVLEDTPGQYSYPCILYEGGKLYITYTYHRKSIAFWEFDVRTE